MFKFSNDLIVKQLNVLVQAPKHNEPLKVDGALQGQSGVIQIKEFNEEARSRSLHRGEPQTSRRPQWRIAGRAESQT